MIIALFKSEKIGMLKESSNSGLLSIFIRILYSGNGLNLGRGYFIIRLLKVII